MFVRLLLNMHQIHLVLTFYFPSCQLVKSQLTLDSLQIMWTKKITTVQLIHFIKTCMLDKWANLQPDAHLSYLSLNSCCVTLLVICMFKELLVDEQPKMHIVLCAHGVVVCYVACVHDLTFSVVFFLSVYLREEKIKNTKSLVRKKTQYQLNQRQSDCWPQASSRDSS